VVADGADVAVVYAREAFFRSAVFGRSVALDGTPGPEVTLLTNGSSTFSAARLGDEVLVASIDYSGDLSSECAMSNTGNPCRGRVNAATWRVTTAVVTDLGPLSAPYERMTEAPRQIAAVQTPDGPRIAWPVAGTERKLELSDGISTVEATTMVDGRDAIATLPPAEATFVWPSTSDARAATLQGLALEGTRTAPIVLGPNLGAASTGTVLAIAGTQGTAIGVLLVEQARSAFVALPPGVQPGQRVALVARGSDFVAAWVEMGPMGSRIVTAPITCECRFRWASRRTPGLRLRLPCPRPTARPCRHHYRPCRHSPS
jgi:hypothetical protein